jgi:hypothetical protein
MAVSGSSGEEGPRKRRPTEPGQVPSHLWHLHVLGALAEPRRGDTGRLPPLSMKEHEYMSMNV